MPRPRTLLLLLVTVFVVACLSAAESIGDGRQVYIVYLAHLPNTDASEPGGFSAVEFAHQDLLNQVLDDDSSASERILHSYKRSLNGFAAKLSEEEAHKLSGMKDVVSVFPSRTLKPLTTRSWDFLGFPQTPKEELPLQGDVIIGMLDSGVWPHSPSFSDEGFGPPPSRWRGTCHNFTCNNSCEPQGLAGGSYKGKIVLCPADNGSLNDGTGPFMAGAAGAVIVGYNPDLAQTVILPALVVTQDQFDEILAYVKSSSSPVGTIDSTETTVDPQAPIAASFSSPGPNLITPGILKPDLAAPGVDIIAAWTLLSSPTGEPEDNRRVLYNIESGTSMACPHASGAAAYVKSYHRDWSPAMIMSALITTATPMNTPANSGYSELKYGAGELNPSKARDPGLVYDASEGDYVAMLCAQGYNATQLAIITGSNATSCDDGANADDLNYPTMAAHVAPGENFTVSFTRTVTNVGAASPDAVYVAKVLLLSGRPGVSVIVSPDRLEFDGQNEKAKFGVSMSGEGLAADEVISAAVVWSDGKHEVRSPLVVFTVDMSI